MPYLLRLAGANVLRMHQFSNVQGDTECVEFVRQAAGAPHMTTWKRGSDVMQSAVGSIRCGPAIATFDSNNKYPADGRGEHAAIYLSHNRIGIPVLFQPITSHAGTKFDCPASMQVDETVKQGLPSWNVAWANSSGAQRYPLSQMRVYGGHPDGGATSNPTIVFAVKARC